MKIRKALFIGEKLYSVAFFMGEASASILPLTGPWRRKKRFVMAISFSFLSLTKSPLSSQAWPSKPQRTFGRNCRPPYCPWKVPSLRCMCRLFTFLVNNIHFAMLLRARFLPLMSSLATIKGKTSSHLLYKEILEGVPRALTTRRSPSLL